MHCGLCIITASDSEGSLLSPQHVWPLTGNSPINDNGQCVWVLKCILDSSPHVCQIMDRLNPFFPRCLPHPHLMHNGLSLLVSVSFLGIHDKQFRKMVALNNTLKYVWWRMIASWLHIFVIPLHISYKIIIHTADLYLHTMHAHSNMAWIPVAHDNFLLIALPLIYVISPCQEDNLSSHDVDMLVVTTIIQCNGSFGSHHSPSTEIKWLPHAEFKFVRQRELAYCVPCWLNSKVGMIRVLLQYQRMRADI